jgi:3-oxoacyl-[acyl-carrier-protein] synthase-3
MGTMVLPPPRVGITASGSCLPSRVMTSQQLQDAVCAGSGLRLPPGITYFRGSGSDLRAVFEKVGAGMYLERFLEATGAPADRIVVTVAQLGNLASATLGVQLARVHAGLRTGDRVLMVGLGGGVSLMTMVWEVA